MKDRDHVQVPPLGDAAVARVERGVFAALDHAAIERGAREHDRRRLPRLGRWWAGVALAAAAAGAFAVVGVRELGRGSGLPARGARIATATSPSHLTIPGASLDVAPRSAISFTTEHDGAVVVALERGAITCEVAPRSRRAPFVVEAGATRVTVIGTRFTVERAGDHARVSVEHGTVEVGDDGMTQLVHAGERYRPRRGEPAGGGGVVEPAPSAAAPAPPPSPASAAAAATPPLPAPSPPSAAPAPRRQAPPPSRTVASASAGERPAHRGRSIVDGPQPAPPPPPPDDRPPAPAAAPIAVTPPPVETPAPPPAAARPPVSTQRRFEAAAGVEVRDPEGALRVYREIAAGGDAWAANALFAEARLELERGRREVSRTLLDAYLQRFPTGANVVDARALLTRLGVDMAGDRRDARP